MTTTSTPNRGSKRLVAAAIVGALALTACGSSSGDAEVASTAPTELADPSDFVVSADDTGNINVATDDTRYGDSVEEFHATGARAEPVNVTIPGYQLIEWEHLVPPGFSSEEVLERYSDRLAAAEPGSAELDELYAQMNAEYDAASVNTEFEDEQIQLAGFVAPLTYDGDNITEFLLVPYFGACIHVPAPPVNQTIMVTLPEGESLTLEESWGAVWVAGTIDVTSVDTDLATAGYSISDAQFGVYENQ